MAPSAAASSCSTTTVSAPRTCSVAGDWVPQNGQISACLAGIPVRLGAAGGTQELLARGCDLIGARSAPLLLEELGERRLRDAPLRADAPALQIAGLQAGNHVRFGHAERLGGVGRARSFPAHRSGARRTSAT